MNESKTLGCELYDYVELACMYHYKLRVCTTDGQSLEGTAMDARADGNGNEFMVMRSPGRELLIRLDAITTMETLTEGAGVGEVRFR
ncbi:MAG: Rho-binding antiterminator [Woeseiaceae bacterium]|nr:Rho-binding antiterminator [Woeseiaceae bacterium]